MSGYEYPEDEFDGADDDGRVPVGVHRAPAPRWRSWLPLLIVIVVVPVLAWGAVTLMGRAVDSGGLKENQHKQIEPTQNIQGC